MKGITEDPTSPLLISYLESLDDNIHSKDYYSYKFDSFDTLVLIGHGLVSNHEIFHHIAKESKNLKRIILFTHQKDKQNIELQDQIKSG